MCRLDLSSTLINQRIPSSLPLSRALRCQRYEEQNRSRQQERQSWANFISYMRAQENEQKQTAQTQTPHWMADTISGGSGGSGINNPTAAAATSISASPPYGAIRHRRAHQDHVALNAQPRGRAATAAEYIDDHANALTAAVINTLFTDRSRIRAVVDEQKSVNVQMSEESLNMQQSNIVIVLVDQVDEKKLDIIHNAAHESPFSMQDSLSVLQQQLQLNSARSSAVPTSVAGPSVMFSASDYVDAALLVRNRAVEVAD